MYRDFLGQLPADVVVHVACPDRAAYEELISSVGPIACQMSPVLTGHAMTTWSRDRWLALAPAGGDGPATLLSPRGEAGAETWPERAGDQRIAFSLAEALPSEAWALKSSLYFDGGDFTADATTVFVTPAVLRRNLQRTVASRDDLLRILHQQLKKKIVLLDEAPDHHAGMFMMVVGTRTVLVGDPSLANPFMGSLSTEALKLPGGADLSAATQRLYDAVAAQVSAAGYRVVRIPLVPATDGKDVSDLSQCDHRPAGGVPGSCTSRHIEGRMR